MQKYLKAIIAIFTFYSVNLITKFLAQFALIFYDPKFITAILTGEYTEEHRRIMRSPEVLGTVYILATLITIVFLFQTGIIRKRDNLRTDGIRWGYALLTIMSMFVFYYLFENSWAYLWSITDYDDAGRDYGILLTIYMAVFSPLVEECIFRAGIQGNIINKGVNKWVALGISAFIFGLVHWSIAMFLPITFFGLVTGWLYMKSRSIYPSFILHTLNNTLSMVLIKTHTTSALDNGGTTVIIAYIVIAAITLTTMVIGGRRMMKE